MTTATTIKRKGDKGVVMEGMLANWYAKNTRGEIAEMEEEARVIAAGLAPGASVLEVAPGPGYLSVALARLGAFNIAGLDISRSFVRIAKAGAKKAGVQVDFRHGDITTAPFATDSFDFIVCRAAFKNFANPNAALAEMHRMLKPGGEALIIDMSRDATDLAIDKLVDGMGLGVLDGFMTRRIFKGTLRKRALSPAGFVALAAASPFGRADIKAEGIGLEVRLRKAA
jgi:ubiquinone/menaquinone biosynthesis C-methylase UbiE